VPALARRFREDHSRTAWVAGRALAELGRKGCRVLERETLAGSPDAASLALEALERIRISRTRTVAT